MLLRHTKYPAVRISLPFGGMLQFEDYLCKVHDDVVQNNGEGFFLELVQLGKVEILDDALSTLESESTEDQELDDAQLDSLLNTELGGEIVEDDEVENEDEGIDDSEDESIQEPQEPVEEEVACGDECDNPHHGHGEELAEPELSDKADAESLEETASPKEEVEPLVIRTTNLPGRPKGKTKKK